MSCPSDTWLDRPCPRRSWATTRYPCPRKKSIWLSQSSELRGQPWWNTMGRPVFGPQSLKKICVPSLVVMVLMVVAPELGVEGVSPRDAAGRLAPTARPAPAIRRWRRERLASVLNGSVIGGPQGVTLVSVAGEQAVSEWAECV